MELELEALKSNIDKRNSQSLLVSSVILLLIFASAVFLVFRTRQAVDSMNRELVAAQTQLVDAQNELAATKTELVKTQDEVLQLNTELTSITTSIQEASNLNKFIYPLEWDDMKMMFAISPDAAPVLATLLELREQTRWGMANTPEDGYNSPGFANLVLQNLGLGSLAELPSDNSDPRPGDLVVYQSGYTMFFFRDPEDIEFVVGMTPFGVTALLYDFGLPVQRVIHTGIN